jgi:hypothetical protein
MRLFGHFGVCRLEPRRSGVSGNHVTPPSHLVELTRPLAPVNSATPRSSRSPTTIAHRPASASRHHCHRRRTINCSFTPSPARLVAHSRFPYCRARSRLHLSARSSPASPPCIVACDPRINLLLKALPALTHSFTHLWLHAHTFTSNCIARSHSSHPLVLPSPSRESLNRSLLSNRNHVARR